MQRHTNGRVQTERGGRLILHRLVRADRRYLACPASFTPFPPPDPHPLAGARFRSRLKKQKSSKRRARNTHVHGLTCTPIHLHSPMVMLPSLPFGLLDRSARSVCSIGQHAAGDPTGICTARIASGEGRLQHALVIRESSLFSNRLTDQRLGPGEALEPALKLNALFADARVLSKVAGTL